VHFTSLRLLETRNIFTILKKLFIAQPEEGWNAIKINVHTHFSTNSFFFLLLSFIIIIISGSRPCMVMWAKHAVCPSERKNQSGKKQTSLYKIPSLREPRAFNKRTQRDVFVFFARADGNLRTYAHNIRWPESRILQAHTTSYSGFLRRVVLLLFYFPALRQNQRQVLGMLERIRFSWFFCLLLYYFSISPKRDCAWWRWYIESGEKRFIDLSDEIYSQRWPYYFKRRDIRPLCWANRNLISNYV
jgi:hypothetical protein